MSTMRPLLLILIIICASLNFCAGCGPSPECRPFVKLSPPERREKFRQYPIEKQLDMYLCAMRIHPPDSFAGAVADQGEQALPLIMAKLKASKSELDKHDLIYLLEVLSDRGHLRGKKDVIVEAGNVLDSMGDGPLKESSAESLKKIQIRNAVKPFTYAQ